MCNYVYAYNKEQSEKKKKHPQLNLMSQHCKMLSQIEETYGGNRGKEWNTPFLLSWEVQFSEELLHLQLDLHNTMQSNA